VSMIEINGEFLLWEGKPLKVGLCSWALAGPPLGRECALVTGGWCGNVQEFGNLLDMRNVFVSVFFCHHRIVLFKRRKHPYRQQQRHI
jgi:hypothetical protein